jgi:SAM-dependent methyltransferase
VAGRRILDVGCGAGPLLAALRERGAVVTGVDSSTKMLELARQRLGDGADLHPADLSSPLPFPDGAFDDVIAYLVLHTIWRTGRPRSPNCGACWRPAADSSWP